MKSFVHLHTKQLDKMDCAHVLEANVKMCFNNGECLPDRLIIARSCRQSRVLMYLSVFYQTFWTANNIETLIQPPKNYTWIKIKDRFFVKNFSYEVVTIFTTHDYRFTTFRRRLVAKEQWKHNSSCLKTIKVESQLEMKYN